MAVESCCFKIRLTKPHFVPILTSVLSVAMTLDAHKYKPKNVFVVYVLLGQIFPPFLLINIKACLVIGMYQQNGWVKVCVVSRAFSKVAEDYVPCKFYPFPIS